MGEKKKRNSIPTSSLYGEIAQVEETSSKLDTQFEKSSDLFRLVNKSKSQKSVQHLKDYLKATQKQAALPKAGNARGGRKDKTVCSEEELKAIQKERGQNQGLSLNKPYLKSVTDLLTLNRTKDKEKSEKSEKKKKS